jgi:hypothetical protein
VYCVFYGLDPFEPVLSTISAKDAAAGEMIAVTFIINKRLTLFSHRNLDYSKPITTHSLHNHTTPTF